MGKRNKNRNRHRNKKSKLDEELQRATPRKWISREPSPLPPDLERFFASKVFIEHAAEQARLSDEIMEIGYRMVDMLFAPVKKNNVE